MKWLETSRTTVDKLWSRTSYTIVLSCRIQHCLDALKTVHDFFSLGGSAPQTPRNSRPLASPIHTGFRRIHVSSGRPETVWEVWEEEPPSENKKIKVRPSNGR
jgi:hypothetical protein